MSDSHTDGPRSPDEARHGSTSAQVPPSRGSSPAGAPPVVNGSAGGRVDEASPEEIGDDLMHRLDTLDDRLQRSQAKMIALLDRKLGDATTAPARPPEAPGGGNQGRPAARPPVGPSPFEAPRGADADDPMETWFNAAPPKVGTDFFDDLPAAAAGAASGAPSPSPIKPGGGRGTPAEAGEASTGRVMASAPTAEEGPTTTVPRAEEQAEARSAEPQRSPVQIGDIVPSHRPAWQSNLLTAVVAAIVVVVALFLVGLF
jgi:hypothetical protein